MWCYRDQLAAAPLRIRMSLHKAVRVINRRDPCLEEIGAESDDGLGVGEVMHGYDVAAEHHAITGAHRFPRERLVTNTLDTHRRAPIINQTIECAGVSLCEENAAAAMCGESVEDALLRVIPADFFPIFFARAATEGLGNAIR